MPNQLLDVMPKILAQALVTLRENAVMPRLVNADYGTEAAQKGSVIHVKVPSKMVTQDVVPAAYSQGTADLQLDTVPIPMNYWKESAFQLSDKDLLEIDGGAVNMQVTEAARAIANDVDNSLLGLYRGIYNYAGTAGTTPLATNLTDALAARKALNANNALMSDRRFVIGVDAEANALGLPAFQQYLQAGTDVTIREGQIGRKIGFDWYLDQNMPNHTKGTVGAGIKTTGAPVTTAVADASNPQAHNPRNSYSVPCDTAGNGTTVVVGDVFSVAGDTQTYVITAPATSNGSGVVTLTFSPAPKVVWATGAAITFRASRAINLAFHRDSFALAVRPLGQSEYGAELGGSQMLTMVDPMTGIPLRLEVRKEFKRIRWSLDCLWGVGLVRPETAVVLAG